MCHSRRSWGWAPCRTLSFRASDADTVHHVRDEAARERRSVADRQVSRRAGRGGARSADDRAQDRLARRARVQGRAQEHGAAGRRRAGGRDAAAHERAREQREPRDAARSGSRQGDQRPRRGQRSSRDGSRIDAGNPLAARRHARRRCPERTRGLPRVRAAQGPGRATAGRAAAGAAGAARHRDLSRAAEECQRHPRSRACRERDQ